MYVQNKHQTETIAQLRAEVQQWKAQLARLEDSSRQEVDSWKDQYRRAEHERARLSVRVEEMLAGQYAVRLSPLSYRTCLDPPSPVECRRACIHGPIHTPYGIR